MELREIPLPTFEDPCPNELGTMAESPPLQFFKEAVDLELDNWLARALAPGHPVPSVAPYWASCGAEALEEAYRLA